MAVQKQGDPVSDRGGPSVGYVGMRVSDDNPLVHPQMVRTHKILVHSVHPKSGPPPPSPQNDILGNFWHLTECGTYGPLLWHLFMHVKKIWDVFANSVCLCYLWVSRCKGRDPMRVEKPTSRNVTTCHHQSPPRTPTPNRPTDRTDPDH